jgi:hypothetical protein
VAAFLAKSDKALAEEAAAKQQQQDGIAAAAGEAASSSGDADAAAGKGSGIDHLHEVGTFAQVHTILAGDSADSAQLLLLGHRRLKREAVVRRPAGWLAGCMDSSGNSSRHWVTAAASDQNFGSRTCCS